MPPAATAPEPGSMESRDFDSEKRKTLRKMSVVFIVGPVLVACFPESSIFYLILTFFTGWATGVHSCDWICLDGLQRGRLPGNNLRGFTVLFAPVGVGIHLLRTRGFVHGLWSCLKATGFAVVLVVLAAVTDLATVAVVKSVRMLLA